MFVDRAKIVVSAGSGGNGCTSFYRDRQVKKGKPNGGDGGDGGSIIFEADNNIKTLYDFRFNRDFRGERGGHGSSNNKTGKRGESLIVKVPPGTLILDADTNLILRDLVKPNERVVVCKAGKGGKGNTRKREGTLGEPGEEKTLLLELKVIADVGIVGFPNVGKSTFISKISRAKSKIASYPFTTKNPILGVIRQEDERLTLADMPGLIEGAHAGRGLGDRFLRHIERTKFLIHMIDIAAVEERDPVEDYKKLNKELSLYSKDLRKGVQLIVANKIDIPEAKDNLKKLRQSVKKKIYPISALTGEGTKELIHALFKKMREYD